MIAGSGVRTSTAGVPGQSPTKDSKCKTAACLGKPNASCPPPVSANGPAAPPAAADAATTAQVPTGTVSVGKLAVRRALASVVRI